MTPFARAIVIAAALALPLGGCVNFDPAEWFDGDWFGNKKPLPGERTSTPAKPGVKDPYQERVYERQADVDSARARLESMERGAR